MLGSGSRATGYAEAISQIPELVDRQHAVLARRVILDREARKALATEAHDGKTGGLAEPADLTISPLLQGDMEPGFAALGPHQTHRGGACGAAVNHDTALPTLERGLVHHAGDLRDIDLIDFALRMRQPRGELAIIGEQEGTTGSKIETTDGHKPHRKIFYEGGHTGAPLGITQRAHHASRLVQQNVDEWLGHHPLAVDLDPRVHFGAHPELSHDPAVDAYAPGYDQFFRLASRRNTGTR